ncbi:MAG: sensor histidine kinase [Bryobacteraceae bacterium]
MSEVPAAHEYLLVNTLGHAAGTLIFGIFLLLLLRDRAGARLRGSRLTMLAAALAFSWNFGSLIVLASKDGEAMATQLVIALSFTALSLLPAVLLDLSLSGRFRVVSYAGYGLAIVATLMHLTELVLPASQYHRAALTLITGGFGLLTAISAACFFRSRDKGLMPRLLAVMALFLFAMSFVHLNHGHIHEAWSEELVIHHAGIPLALMVLLQDYRFVLLDAFIRVLANVLLAGGMTFAAASLVNRFPKLFDSAGDPFHRGLLLMSACLLLVLFALLRGGLQKLLTRILFHRPDLESTLWELRASGLTEESEGEYLRRASRMLAEFMRAELILAPVHLFSELEKSDFVLPAPPGDLPSLRDDLERSGVEVIVPIRLSGVPRFVLLGRRQGGRRYLSEDFDVLARIGTHITEQVEHYRESEMRRLVTQAELRALQSQINPHFLFNALNALYGIIPRDAKGARRTVLNLSEIFRYCLHSEKSFIPLEEELRIVKAYLEIESLRLGPKLRTQIDVDEEAARVPIPILSIQPLIENAVKHGVASRAEGGSIRLEIKMPAEGLSVCVQDTGRGFASTGRRPSDGAGVGLENVARRLKLCYGPEADLRIDSGPEGSSVRFLVPRVHVEQAVAAP